MRGTTTIRYILAALTAISIPVSALAQTVATPASPLLVYAVDSAGSAGTGYTGLVWGYQVDQGSGTLTPLPSFVQPTPPCYDPQSLAADPTGRYLYVGCHNGANPFSVVSGAVVLYNIDPASGALQLAGVGDPSGGSELPIVMHPSGKFLYGMGGEGTSINLFTVDSLGVPTGGAAAAGTYTFSFAPGTSPGLPESLLIDPSGRFLYCGTAAPYGTQGVVFAFSIDQTTGALSELPTFQFGTNNALGGAASLAMTPDGRFLFAGSDSNILTEFPVDPATGLLGAPTSVTAGQMAPTALSPKGIAVDPTGQYVFAGGQTFSIDAASGGLTPLETTPADYAHSMTFNPSGSFFFYLVNNTTVTVNSVNLGHLTPTGSQTVSSIFGNPLYDLAVVQPPTTINFPPSVTLTFKNVTLAGTTTLNSAGACPAAPTGYALGATCYDISTTATYTPPVKVCITDASVTAASSLFHFEAGAWVDITASAIPPTVCGLAASLSPFAIGKPITQVATTTSVVPSANPAYPGQLVTFTATVTPVSGAGVPTGTVTFSDNGTLLGTVTLPGATSVSTSSLTLGPHTITAQYFGDLNFTGSTSAVSEAINPAPTTTFLTSLGPTVSGQAVGFTVTVVAPVGTPTGTTVTLTEGGTVIGSGLLASGIAVLGVAMTTGTHTIQASYPGNGFFLPSTSAPWLQVVNPGPGTVGLSVAPNPSSFGQAVTMTAVITAPFNNALTGSVTFMDGATALVTVPVAGNSASTVSATTSSLLAGLHPSITAVYTGNANVIGGTSSAVPLTVNKAATTVALSSSVNPAAVNQSVTFTATVTGQFGGIPTGTITFMSGGATALGPPATLSSGSTTFTTSFATAATFAITAVYSGDANYLARTSPGFSEAVTAGTRTATTTVLTSSGSPSLVGQAVTFTARVSSTLGAPPNGETVTFRDVATATTIGTGTITGGVATFTTSSLTAASHSITAAYAGDSAFLGSTSNRVTQVVRKSSTHTVLTSSLNPSLAGQAVTFTATVTTTGPLPLTGTVTFRSGFTTLLAPVQVSAAGTATFTATALAKGTKFITATYNGDSANSLSLSNLVRQVVK